MCGLVAFFSGHTNGLGYDEAKAFSDMLFVDTLRGWDSTGAFSVSNRGNVHMLKAALTGPDFICTQDYKDMQTEAVRDGIFLVGHNRAATRGTINDVNAHPFVINDNIILVQNGTWNGDHTHIKNTEVDTETVAHIIHDEVDIEKALQKINAAYALIWYNVKEKAMYAIRNSQRPLWVARTKRGGEMLASEASTILFASMRQGIELTGKPYEIAPGHLCKWQLDDKQFTWEFEGNDVDYMYKHTGGTNYSNFPSRHRFYGGSGYEHDVTDYYPNLPEKPTKPFDNVQQLTRSSNDISIPIAQVVAQGQAKDWEMSETKATELHQDFSIRPQNKELAVEWVDYIKANNRKDCSIFYIVGKPLTTDSSATPTAMVYSLISDRDEMQIIDMISHSLYSVKTSTALKLKVGNTENYVVTVFCHDLKKLNLKEENAPQTTPVH